MTNYDREWDDVRNAVGFAAECAHLASLFYEGSLRSDAATAIQAIERFAANGRTDSDDHTGPLAVGASYPTLKHATACYDAAIRASDTGVPLAKANRKAAAEAVRADDEAWLTADRAADRAAEIIADYATFHASDAAARVAEACSKVNQARIAYDLAKRAVKKTASAIRRAPSQAAGRAAEAAAGAGVDDSELAVAYARWGVRDLLGDRPIGKELRQAAGACIVAGNEAFARELVSER